MESHDPNTQHIRRIQAEFVNVQAGEQLASDELCRERREEAAREDVDVRGPHD